jgi:hypothetical protein
VVAVVVRLLQMEIVEAQAAALDLFSLPVMERQAKEVMEGKVYRMVLDLAQAVVAVKAKQGAPQLLILFT